MPHSIPALPGIVAISSYFDPVTEQPITEGVCFLGAAASDGTLSRLEYDDGSPVACTIPDGFVGADLNDEDIFGGGDPVLSDLVPTDARLATASDRTAYDPGE